MNMSLCSMKKFLWMSSHFHGSDGWRNSYETFKLKKKKEIVKKMSVKNLYLQNLAYQ